MVYILDKIGMYKKTEYATGEVNYSARIWHPVTWVIILLAVFCIFLTKGGEAFKEIKEFVKENTA